MAGASQSDSSLYYSLVVTFRTGHLIPTLARRFSQMRCKGTAFFEVLKIFSAIKLLKISSLHNFLNIDKMVDRILLTR